MNAVVFPGQGSQHTGMGKSLYDSSVLAKKRFNQANEILGFDISKIMFEGAQEDLKQTKVTQPAIFLHSVILFETLKKDFDISCVAGHSLGEFSALVANECLSFEEGLKLVYQRAEAMQEACNLKPSSMAAILNLDDDKIDEVCLQVEGIVQPANYNCEGQTVISGETESVSKACELAKEMGAKRAIVLPVNGAFHSPLMNPAQEKLKKAIEKSTFKTPICPVYHNVDALPNVNPETMKEKLIVQLTSPVKWKQTMANMINNKVSGVIEIGPGKVLQGLFKKIKAELDIKGFS